MLQAKNAKVTLPQEIGNMVVENDPLLQTQGNTQSREPPTHPLALYDLPSSAMFPPPEHPPHLYHLYWPPAADIHGSGTQRVVDWEGMGGTGELKPAISIQNSPPTQISQQEIQRNNG